MKHLFIIVTMLMSFCAFANTDADLIKSLQDKGFSNTDVETILKIVKDRDNGVAMKTGTVKFYNDAKGFGLIVSPDGTSVEFDSNQCFIAGDNVEYKLQEGKKGLNAVNVKLARSINDGKKGFCSIIR